MPRMEIAPMCLKCQDTREGWGCCDVACSYSIAIDAIFNLCYNGCEPCRHIQACTSDPRDCGYWVDRKYPIEVKV